MEHDLHVQCSKGIVDVRCTPCGTEHRFEGAGSWARAFDTMREHRDPRGVNDTAKREPAQLLFVDLCDLAFCSPDFDVVYSFHEAQAVAWLTARLRRYGHEVPYDVVERAYTEWVYRPRHPGHKVAP